MVRKVLFPLILMWCGMAVAADGGCTRAVAVGSVPDGATATKEEVLAAKEQVQSFVSESQAFLDCLSKDITSAQERVKAVMTEEGSEEETAARAAHKALVTEYDEVVGEMQDLAGRFNATVRAFKAR
jgi:dsDNA-specific endonuclease/ATPase MutS2